MADLREFAPVAALTTAADLLAVNRSDRVIEQLSTVRQRVGEVGTSSALADVDERAVALRLV